MPCLLLAAAACGTTPTAGSETSGVGGASTGGFLPPTEGATTTTTSSSGASTGLGSSSGDSTTNDDDPSDTGFITDPDAGSVSVECSLFEQDCPEGEKCAPWANDGGDSLNATRCVPVARNAALPGEPCTVEGSPLSGIDSCAFGSMCWNLDPGTLEGECLARCTGTQGNPTCADPTQTCAEGVLNLCHPWCDPVTQADCGSGQGCYPISESFFCAPDASGEDGAPFSECEVHNACDPGTTCVNPTLSDTCSPDTGGCCLPWCDLSAPDCPGDLVCVPWFEEGEAPVGSEFVGLCVDEAGLP